MINVSVLFYSSTGNVLRLAEAAAGAATKAGAEVRLCRVPELVEEPATTDRQAWRRTAAAVAGLPTATLDDLELADAILVGTPVRFGLPAPQLLHFLDTAAAPSIAGRLADKAVGAFASGSAPHGGQVSAVLALHNLFCHWGAVIVPTGSTDPVLFRPSNGSPYGTANVSRNEPGNVTEDNLAAVEFQARRTVAVAAALKAGLRDG